MNERLDPQQQWIPSVDADLPHVDTPTFPKLQCESPREQAFTMGFFTRMLFSCLIDADRTCTEAFCSPERAEERALPQPSLADLREQLDRYLHEKQHAAEATPVNLLRRSILDQCLNAAKGRPGVYSLQVPTGGGKTLSSLAFALHHASDKTRRVVMAIPFTSIIEQTADEYRKALGIHAERGLVEHHTNIAPQKDTRANQMAAENWDAPLIVTTNVQLLESLFAARTRACRKLHRLANSIIVLDEAQTLPVDLLAPTLRALHELVENYGCTIVLCTATQPALEYRAEEFPIGLQQVKPIMEAPEILFAQMRRAEVDHVGKLTDEDLSRRLAAEEQVLCIVSTRRDAASLFTLLRGRCHADSVFHLSTLMCGAHRREVLEKIRKRLRPETGSPLPTRIVSTSLIEAGVDIDLPVVYRADAGFDSIAQAAGRCNREGRLAMGSVHVFTPERALPRGQQQAAANTAKELRPQFADPLTPEAIREYFRLTYWKRTADWDKHRVLECMKVGSRSEELFFQFRTMEERYVLIREKSVPILVPYDIGAKALARDLQNPHIDFVSQRRLQPYLVSVPEYAAKELEHAGALLQHESGVCILLREDLYSDDKGLQCTDIKLDSMLWSV